tara:strand:+ start:398 stop:889 length:492 start_codon:yes stop_codon:yes gene_type:complete
MSVYNTKDTPVSETKLRELLSMKGEGEAVPEGVSIFYTDRKTKKVKKVEKKVGGRATPRTFDKRNTDKVGSMDKSDIDTKGNIKSPRTFKVYEKGEARKGTDLEYLRKRRGKQKITKPIRPDRSSPKELYNISPPFRLKQGGAVKKLKGTGVALRGFGKALKR